METIAQFRCKLRYSFDHYTFNLNSCLTDTMKQKISLFAIQKS